MAIRNTFNAYGSVAKFLHWLIALMLIAMLVFGYFLEDIPKDFQPTTYNLHKLTGLTILALMLVRLFWRMTNLKPALPLDTPLWQHYAEKISHWLLYISIIAMPIAGWIGSSAAGHPPRLGGMELGLPLEKNKALDDAAFDIHNTLAIVIIVLLSIHVLAALYHHFIKKDDILRRMMPHRCDR